MQILPFLILLTITSSALAQPTLTIGPNTNVVGSGAVYVQTNTFDARYESTDFCVEPSSFLVTSLFTTILDFSPL